MTTRLKRKLNDLGVDTASSKANESFCLIGTPLPPLEKSKDTGEFVPLWKQEVRDEKGRRRLHGAFTGGFSAGYFNSVGSKEGWAPATFVSSRGDRAKQKAARPEDFMDEEDLAELRDSQKLVDTTEETDIFGGTQAERTKAGEEEKDSITAALEASLLPPPKDSAGARILRKMGWRLGHGIGPKVTWEQRKRQDAQSSSVSAIADDLNADDEEAKKHLYPTRDTKVPLFRRKDNAHGLGYTPGLGLTEMTAGAARDAKGPSGPNLSAGFGLGALNEADDDDVDIYESGFNKGSNRLVYEAEEDDGQRVLLGSRNKNKPAVREEPKPSLQHASQRFHDGTPVLAGFILSDRPVAEDKWFPLPEIPQDWTPNPNRVWGGKENVAGADQQQSTIPRTQHVDHRTWKTGISADQRGAMLGETPLPQAPRSVFDYLAPADRDRLLNARTGPSASSTALGPIPAVAPTPIYVPRLEPPMARAALHGFQPFTADPVKHARYTAYLQSQASMEEESTLKPFVGQSIEEFNKELSDFAKSAQIFKPVSAAMAGRFTSAAIEENLNKPQEGLHTPSAAAPKTYLDDDESTERKEEKKEESAKESAVRMGLFGPLTREVRAWQPARLLCKRFGVKDPNPEISADEVPTGQRGVSFASASSTTQQLQDVVKADSAAVADTEKPHTGGRRDLANIGLGEDETQGQDTLTYERPAKDIFKAIFASDDEDFEDEDGVEGDRNEGVPTDTVAPDTVEDLAGTVSDVKEPIPAHLTTTDSKTTPYDLTSTNADISMDTIDMNTFKPTFVPRSERENHKSSDGKDKDKKRKKKKKVTLVSFEVEDGDGDGIVEGGERKSERERPKKSKKREHRQTVEDDDAMWVEKPPPEAVQDVVSSKRPSSTLMSTQDKGQSDPDGSPAKSRKRAIDFM